MAAPLGNQFWKLRSKHGRDAIFASPELMWEAACEFYEWCEENPLIETVHDKTNEVGLGSKIVKVQLPKMRAFTVEALCLYIGTNKTYFNDFYDRVKDKEDDMSKDFSEVITRIRETNFVQKFTGAAAGLLKENIISLEADMKRRVEIDVNERTSVANLFPDELDE